MNSSAMRKLGFLVFVITSLPGYGQEGTVGDGLIDGPGLFSGEAGAFELLRTGDNQSGNSQHEYGGSGNSNTGTSKPSNYTNEAAAQMAASTEPATEVNSGEFTLFKTWLLAKKENSAEYQEFKMWLSFLEYKKQTANK